MILALVKSEQAHSTRPFPPVTTKTPSEHNKYIKQLS